MTARCDFHNHSTASDGRLSPTEVVDLAARNGVKVFALTDHDSTEGIAEARVAAAKHEGFTLIPGVELSTDIEGDEVHVLGYFDFDEIEDPALQAELARFRAGRFERGRLMTEKLASLGKPVSWQRVLEIAGEASVGRPHVALAMVEAGHVASTNEAFDRYIGRNGPAYVDREKMTPRQAVEALVRFGATPVLAHPRYMKDVEAVLPELIAAGLEGMEVYYKDSDAQLMARMLSIAKRYGLMPLGGSDFHGLPRDDECEPGNIPLPDAVAAEFLEKYLPWVPRAALV
ncbi:MAG TPA: PHP domain-containing protein [Dehalococcoidia bacterium]|nr:PHP domain-containing protein [Dehalococcoidia bacterium]